MASIGHEGQNGELKRILFRDADGKQKSLRLGKCSQRTAEKALAGFERVLESHRLGCTLHPDGVKWLADIDARTHSKVVKLGLAQPRQGENLHTLGTLLSRFVANASVKPGTHAAYRQTTTSLEAYLKPETPLASITTEHADGWRKAIAEPLPAGKDADGKPRFRVLSAATQAKRVHVARAIFRKAVRWGMISTNPFAEVHAGSQANPERAFYVTEESIRTILDACPDNQWRAIIALSRFAGLRCPSETVALRWGDVNWERGRLTVRSPKTAGHEGHAVRVVPIAPQLRPILQELFDRALPGTEPVVPRLRDPSVNLRTTFSKIIARSGLKPWPRLFHNLRSSCAMDWVEVAPAHAVASWLGHSPLIAAQHYLHTRDAHFDRITGPTNSAAIPATQAHQRETTGAEPEGVQCGFSAELVGVGIGCAPMENEEWAILDSNQ